MPRHPDDEAKTYPEFKALPPQLTSEGIFANTPIYGDYFTNPQPLKPAASLASTEDKNPSVAGKQPPSQRRLQQKRWFTASKVKLQNEAQALFILLNYYASCAGFVGAIRAALLEVLPNLLLRATIFISPGARILGGLKMLKKTFLQSQDPWTRALILVCGLCLIGFGVAALLYPLYGFTFTAASTLCNVVLSLWHVACALKNKYWDNNSWKETQTQLKALEKELHRIITEEKILDPYLEYRERRSHPSDLNASQASIYFQLDTLEHRILELKNQHQQLNADLAMKIHNLSLCLLALIGIILALFPPTTIAGVTIILLTNIHGLAFGSNLKEKWPQALKKNLFPEVCLESGKELRTKVQAYQALPQPSSTAMATHAFSASTPAPSQDPQPVSLEEKLPAEKLTSAFWARLEKRQEERQTEPTNTAPDVDLELVPVIHA